ncbi:MAG: glycoside hydrolase family 3 N-terminal domain-containing protein [Bacteroides sp.]
MNIRLKTLLAGVVSLPMMAFSGGGEAHKANTPLYKDPTQSVEKRVADLMQRMTLEEKVAQLCQYVGPGHIRETQAKFKGQKVAKGDDAHGFYPDLSINDLLELTKKGMVGSFLHVVTPEESNELQKLAMQSRLQIPLIVGIDAIHGNALVSGTTVYPTPIGQAASFDTDLVEKMSRESALEVRAAGAHWTFTPNIDVARDARWGRVGETFGEDPYLVTRMGVATIKGYQGADFMGQDKVIACAKHLIAGSEPSNGTNAAPMDVSERTLREVYLPPYKAAVEEAKVFTVMAAHNELNGIPCHADKWMMTDIIRDEYKFNGFIVSDWMDVERIYDLHHYAPTMKDAYYEAVNAGLDMHMHGPGFAEGLIELVKEGRLSEAQIDRGCRAILEAKFKLGLFEHPYVDLKNYKKTVFNAQHRQTALEAAEKSIVLLKNDGLLPLDLSKYKNILVTGPNANNHTILGDWTLQQPEENVVTVLEGLQMAAGKDKVKFYDYGDDVKQRSPEKVKAAAELAKKSDLAIVVVGENPLRYQKTKTCGENVDRMGLDLLGTQRELIQAIHRTGVPTIVVLVGGRPLSVNWTAQNVPALIQAFEPGSFGGTALANILIGKTNPSAKLPVSIPRHAGQIQMIYNHKPSQYFHPYKDGAITPLYPFGFGLSYSKFVIDAPTVSKNKISDKETFEVRVKVMNQSGREGTEVVQLYIRDLYSSATRPVKELKDFKRVNLKAGETKEVIFTVTPDKLAFFNREMKYAVEKGVFEVMVGPSSVDKDLKKVVVEVM